jgi:hypothetical protein
MTAQWIRWRKHVSLKRWYLSAKLHSVASQKIIISSRKWSCARQTPFCGCTDTPVKSNHWYESSLWRKVLFHCFCYVYLFTYLLRKVELALSPKSAVYYSALRSPPERSPREIYYEHSGSGTGYSRFFLVCYHFTNPPCSFLYRGWVIGLIISRSVI